MTMKIYTFEDKREENKKAELAIVENGHEVGRIDSLFADRIILLNEGKKENSFDVCREQNYKMHAAKKHQGGIITDMMFRLASPLDADEPVPPSGLLIVIQALAAGVPVVVCTDAAEVGGHHSKALHWIYDGYIVPAKAYGEGVPFGYVDNKDWDAVVKLLEQIHAQQKKKEVEK